MNYLMKVAFRPVMQCRRPDYGPVWNACKQTYLRMWQCVTCKLLNTGAAPAPAGCIDQAYSQALNGGCLDLL